MVALGGVEGELAEELAGVVVDVPDLEGTRTVTRVVASVRIRGALLPAGP